jgi:hypothetical protein
MAGEPQAQTLYRIVSRDPPLEEDFWSQAEARRPAPSADPLLVERWQGVSMFDSLRVARLMARRHPRLGSFIAELRTPDGPGIRCQRTGRPGHYTVWGRPAAMLACVVAVWSTGE